MVAHSEILMKTTAKYPYRQTDIKVFTLPAGQFSASFDDVFQGNIPTKLLVGMNSAQAYSGNLQKNPFYLKHYDTNFIGFYVDGESVPTQPLRMNFEANQYVEAYQSIFTATGKDMSVKTCRMLATVSAVTTIKTARLCLAF